MLTDDGPLPIEVPRDREGIFAPRSIAKHERRFTDFDDRILALYARGTTAREIQALLAEIYAVEVSPALTGMVTDAVLDELTAWQPGPLEPMYPVVFFDARRVKIRDEATVRTKAVYLAIAVLPDGSRDGGRGGARGFTRRPRSHPGSVDRADRRRQAPCFATPPRLRLAVFATCASRELSPRPPRLRVSPLRGLRASAWTLSVPFASSE